MDKKIAVTVTALHRFVCNFTSLSAITPFYFDAAALLVLIVVEVLV
jgi:hypothetical protein